MATVIGEAAMNRLSIRLMIALFLLAGISAAGPILAYQLSTSVLR